MTTQEAKSVTIGQQLNLLDTSNTPGRKIAPTKGGAVEVLGIFKEQSGHIHFDVGLFLPAGESPLKSRDTDDEIDGSNTYWLHPSRFNL